MHYPVSSIRDSIYNKLLPLVNVEGVYKYSTGNPSGFPYIVIEFAGNNSEQIDQCTVYREYKFNVKVYAEMNQDISNTEVGEDKIVELFDSIIDIFDQDYTLGNTVNNIIPVSSECGYITDDSKGILRVCTIALLVKKEYNIHS